MNMDDEMLTSASAPPRTTRQPWWRQPLVLSAVGGAAAAAVVITIVAVNAGDTSETLAAPTTVSYDLAASGILQSCLPVADIQPIPGSDALAGTVVSVEGGMVVLAVDRWYAGGNADRVQLEGADESVALDGVEFVVGEDYLVTAADGAVQICGVSGPATPELEQRYDQWYG